MKKGTVQAYYGGGKGKTTAALGQGIMAASQGKTVTVIQFLKGKNTPEIDFISRLEPEIKVFRFEKFNDFFENLEGEEKKEEMNNIRNGLNFAKKVLTTKASDVIILDEILGLLQYNIATKEDIQAIIACKDEETELILTGIRMDPELMPFIDELYKIETIKKEQN